jgi:cytoskeletal protein CcmA (bactofilin family)
MIKSTSATIVSAAARLSGDLVTDEDVVLAGAFEGALRTTRTLQITPTGSLQGEAHAESVLVLGRVEGPIHAVDRVELQAGCFVQGDLSAQRVRIHDDAVFNGRCSIAGPEAARRQYLVPAVLQTFGAAPSPQALTAVQDAAAALLRGFGFDLEVRAERSGNGPQALRPIFRSREPMPYARLREQLRSLEVALQQASDAESPSKNTGEPLQTTGLDGARALLAALAQLRDSALMLGPVIVTRFEAERGPRLAVRVRQDSLPPVAPAEGAAPDPSALLLSLQKAQTEVARDLATSLHGRGNGSKE